MSGSLFGKNFRLSTFGESHGPALGAIIDGCPSNISLSLEDIMKNINRRKPGNPQVATARLETDQVEILSGIFEGKTTGAPIALLIRNMDQKSHDYSTIKEVYRPSHADYTFDQKYGFRDYRGGGRSSGRETAARVAGGAIAIAFLKELGIQITAYTRSIGPVMVPADEIDLSQILLNPVNMPHMQKAEEALAYIAKVKSQQDSVGGTVECIVHGLKPGLGEPVFDKLDALLAYAIMGIGGVKAFEVGVGTQASTLLGSQYNDAFYAEEGTVHKKTNHSGGILGGISDGSSICIRAHFKPTPSISQKQKTITASLQNTVLEIKGRHDPVIVPRAVVVVESMVALTLADLLLSHLGSNLETVKKLYK
ncbi:chorismate synthase [Sporanaerobium hydrogeniformans]|uniref:Chorismate synthase n=1 Tax=Sporanaerobium hydrogeniformans TaxID=3072179 RepID=A0AC61DGA3_9FIRM|nr:chorismate synthase [Sporanaerobium hydrogeniformans]PHV72063.1 chorismate synthase [Sporanaerobium hydrogeniformans]